MSSINFEPITPERILETDNLLKALEKVVSNKGGAGVDGMKNSLLRCYIILHPNEISVTLSLESRGGFSIGQLLKTSKPKQV